MKIEKGTQPMNKNDTIDAAKDISYAASTV